MSAKTDTEVIIGGKMITVTGNESAEYMQKVATYINNKISDCQKTDSFKKQDRDTQTLLIQLNMADDYFKSKKQIELLEQDIKAKENELYDLKHELIATQIMATVIRCFSRPLKRFFSFIGPPGRQGVPSVFFIIIAA